MTIKGNPPGLYTQSARHPRGQVPVCDLQEDTGHGRLVHRELKIVTPTGASAST